MHSPLVNGMMMSPLYKECCVLLLFLSAASVATPSPSPSAAPAQVRPALVLTLPTEGENEPKPKVAVPVPRKPCNAGCLSAIEAVTMADTVAPKAGIAGEFDLTIASIGERQGRFYLNSEEDYRERNCLSVVLTPHVVQSLVGSVSLSDLAVRMKGKRIAVQGIARRVRIDLTEKGQATGTYYYQVHVVVTEPRQIVMN